MPAATDTAAPFVTHVGEQTVTRDQILKAMAEFDKRELRDKPTIGDNHNGWFVEQQGRHYNTKWLLKLATNIGLAKFKNKQAREALSALGFEPELDPRWQVKEQEDHPPLDDNQGEESADAEELIFDLERNLQKALRANIEQLEAKLKITDGGKELTVVFPAEEPKRGLIDITAEDEHGTPVVIELKAHTAGRHAVGQVLSYMGAFNGGKKPIRGILVAEEFTPQAIAAAHVVPNLQLMKYTFKFNFQITSAVKPN